MRTSNQSRLKSVWFAVCDVGEWFKQQIINFVLGVIIVAAVILAILIIVVGLEWLLRDTPFERMGILGLIVIGFVIVAVILPTGKGAVKRFNTWRGRR